MAEINEAPISRLDRAIKAAGIPILGVRGSPGSITIDFDPSATGPQQTQANNIAAAFDFTPRRKRGYAALIADIAALSAADRNKLLAAVAADFLRNHPDFAQRFSIAIDGDEADT